MFLSKIFSVAAFALAAAAATAVAPALVTEPSRTAALTSPDLTARTPADDAIKLPASASPVPSAGPARPIAGWLVFCRTYADECRVDPSEDDTIRLTPALWKQINAVNTGVNTAISPKTDVEHWGQLDKWDFAEDGFGDCEDYQLLKRRQLVALGLPRRAMMMTVVLDERNEGHAVLILRTDRGDIVLDNKRNDILPWLRTSYTYVKRESQTDVAWVSLNHVSGVTATAAR